MGGRWRGGGRWAVLAVGVAVLAGAAGLGAGPARAQLKDILVAPKTLIDRAIEARSAADIARDNEIVLKVNAIMAELGTIKASTEIYEQRLLVTGLFDDKATYDDFERKVRAVEGVKTLYWHVAHMSAARQKSEAHRVMDWTDVLAMEAKAEARLIGTRGVADVNFRVAADALGAVYLLGRARSGEEHAKAVARVGEGGGVRKVIDYAEVRP